MNRRLWRENGATAINHLINLSFPSFTFTAVCRLCRFPFCIKIKRTCLGCSSRQSRLGDINATSTSPSTLFALLRWINLTKTEYIIFLQECTIQISINGKSREDVHSGQRSRGFRVGHCQIINTKIIDFVTRAKLKADLRSDNTGRAVHYRDILHL